MQGNNSSETRSTSTGTAMPSEPAASAASSVAEVIRQMSCRKRPATRWINEVSTETSKWKEPVSLFASKCTVKEKPLSFRGRFITTARVSLA